MSSRRSTRRSADLVLVALLLAGCGTVAPTEAPTDAPSAPVPTGTSRPAAEIYAEIRAAVEQIRRLKPSAAVEPVTIDETQLRTNLEAEFDAAQTPEQLRDSEDLLITLGLLPAGASLRQETLDFQTGQVAGYYSPDKDQLFVVRRSGGPGPVDEVTYAHEFTHQLQDQALGLDALGIDVVDQSDRSIARLALVEGDATSVQSTWMTSNLDSRELGEVLAAGLDPAALAAFQNAPAFLRETALFPYQDGLAFVGRLRASGDFSAVDAAFADPPDSTEQVLHPAKYLEREDPIEIVVPNDLAGKVGAGWTAAAQDTLGELILRIWLVEGGVPPATSRAAAAGWGGDRAVLLRGPNGAVCVGLGTAWDTAADATEFLDAVGDISIGAAGPGAIVQRATQPKAVFLGFGACDGEVAEALAR
jgi:hypothetical protein